MISHIHSRHCADSSVPVGMTNIISQRFIERQSQQGVATLLAVLVLLSLISVIAIIGVQIAGSGLTDTTQQSQSVRALALAESGVEHTIRRLQLPGFACTDGTLVLNQPFANGSFVTPNGINTDFDNVTLLPANQCRIRATGISGNISRTVEAVVDYSAGGGAGIVYVGSRSALRNNGTTLSWNHNIAAGVDRILVVAIAIRLNGGATHTVQSLTYAGQPLQLIGTVNSIGGGTDVRTELWYLINPPTGNNQVQATLTGANTRIIGGSLYLTGSNQTTPIDASSFNGGSGWVPNTNLTTTVDNTWLIDGLTVGGNPGVFPLSGQTVQFTRSGGGNPRIQLKMATKGPKSPAGAENHSWLKFFSNTRWAIGMAALRPATGGGGGVIRWREIARP